MIENIFDFFGISSASGKSIAIGIFISILTAIIFKISKLSFRTLSRAFKKIKRFLPNKFDQIVDSAYDHFALMKTNPQILIMEFLKISLIFLFLNLFICNGSSAPPDKPEIAPTPIDISSLSIGQLIFGIIIIILGLFLYFYIVYSVYRVFSAYYQYKKSLLNKQRENDNSYDPKDSISFDEEQELE